MKTDKKAALDAALLQIEKSLGKEMVIKLGDKPRTDLDVIPTGILPLDIALGVGGLARGRIMEIMGWEGTGKSTLAQHIVAEAQKAGGAVAYIDFENCLDPVYASSLGVNVEDLYISQPGCFEEGMEVVEKLVSSGAIDFVVIDSVAAMTPKAEIEGEFGDATMGLHARLMSQAMRKINSIVSKTNTTILFINQWRQKIGVMFGDNRTTPGGHALKFYASVRMDISRMESIKDGEVVIGNKVKVKVIKNKVAAPFKQAEFNVIFGKGFDKVSYLFEQGVIEGFIEKAGNTYSVGTEKLAVGKDASISSLLGRPDLCDSIEKSIRDKYFPKVS